MHRLSGPEYGQVTSWDADKVHDWSIVGYPRGILILEAQRQLMKFLRGLVQRTTEGLEVQPGLLTGSDGPWLTWKSDFKHAGFTEFASSYLNQPFSPPPAFNINIMIIIAESRLKWSEDRLW